MPVSYEPPKPVAPMTSAAFGAAQQYNAAAPTIAAMRQQQLQAGIAGANAYQHGIDTTTQRGIAAGNQSTQLELQKQAFLHQTRQEEFQRAQQQAMQAEHQRAQAETQAREAENRQRQQEQHFQQQVEASRIHLNHQEELFLQRNQNSKAAVDQMFAEGKIDQEAHTEMVAQIHKIAGPLEIRKVKSQAMMAEAHTEELKSQAKLQMQMEGKRAELAAKTAPERTVPIINPAVEARVRAEMGPPPRVAGPMAALARKAYEDEVKRRVLADPQGVEAHVYTDIDGKTYIHKPEREKAEKGGAAPGTMSNSAFQSIENQEKARIDSYVRQVQKNDPNQIDNDAGWTNEKKQEKLAHDMRMRLGMPRDPATWDIPPTYEEYAAWKQYEVTRPVAKGRRFGMSGVEGNAQGLAPGNPGGQAQNEAPKEPSAAQSPTDHYATRTPQPSFRRDEDATPEQKEQIGIWNEIIKRVGDEPHNRKAAEWATDRLRDFGSLAAMQRESPATYARYMEIFKGLTIGRKPDQKPDPRRDPERYVSVPMY